jgi:branched-chain amino acid transport system permease protein
MFVLGAAAAGLNLLVGNSGRVSLVHGALFGIGAYGTAILSVSARCPVYLSIASGTLLGGSCSWLISRLARRARGDTFALLTFSIHLIFFELITNWSALTRGPIGIAGIPKPQIWLLDPLKQWSLLVGGFLVLAVVTWVTSSIGSSPVARALLVMRDEEVFSESLGVDCNTLGQQLFATSGLLCALSGAFYAHLVGFLAPQMVDEMLSVSLLSMVVVGGAGSAAGGIAGAIVVVGLPEIARFVGASGPELANWRQILVGLFLVVLMLRHPKGLFGLYELGGRL